MHERGPDLGPLIDDWLREYGIESRLEVSATTVLDGESARDLVVCRDALDGPGWRDTLATIGKLAGKALVVVVPNGESWSARARAALGRASPQWSHTKTLAPELWKIGRVREHVFTGGTRRNASFHVFLVDLRPRTPRQRRRLAIKPPEPSEPG